MRTLHLQNLEIWLDQVKLGFNILFDRKCAFQTSLSLQWKLFEIIQTLQMILILESSKAYSVRTFQCWPFKCNNMEQPSTAICEWFFLEERKQKSKW